MQMINQTLLDTKDQLEVASIINKKRRVQIPWTLSEIKKLLIGVYFFGVGHWVIIHEMMKFDKKRLFSDLKDKWRNLILEQKRSKVPILYRKLALAILNKQQSRDYLKPSFDNSIERAWSSILKEYTPFVKHVIRPGEKLIHIKD